MSHASTRWAARRFRGRRGHPGRHPPSPSEAGELSCRELVQTYIDRIEAFDRGGPGINSIIAVNPKAIEDAAEPWTPSRAASGPIGTAPRRTRRPEGPDRRCRHGHDDGVGAVQGLFPRPRRVRRRAIEARRAPSSWPRQPSERWEAAIRMGRCSARPGTRMPWTAPLGDRPEVRPRQMTANLGAIGVGQEGFASIRRPSAWNSIVGMRPTAGLVSRGGVYSGWPGVQGVAGTHDAHRRGCCRPARRASPGTTRRTHSRRWAWAHASRDVRRAVSTPGPWRAPGSASFASRWGSAANPAQRTSHRYRRYSTGP